MPRETRDGIYLLNPENGNQGLILEAIELYKRFLKKQSENTALKDLYVLARTRFNLPDNHSWINKSWYSGDSLQKGIIQNIRDSILITPLVDTIDKEGNVERKAILNTSAQPQIGFPLKEHKDFLWVLAQNLFPGQVPIKSDVDNWNSIIWNEKHFIRYSPKYFVIEISKFNNVGNLAMQLYSNQKETDKTLSWLNSFIVFITKTIGNENLLNYKENSLSYPIIPNRNLDFTFQSNLHQDVGHNGGIINDELLDIHSRFYGKNYKDVLLHQSMKGVLNLSTEPITEGKVTEEIKSIAGNLLREEYLDLAHKNNLSTLYTWVTNNRPRSTQLFAGLRLEKILYELVPNESSGYITDMLEKDRNGILSLKRQSEIINDPDLEQKLLLGEMVLAQKRQQEEEFKWKKKIGNIFECIFQKAIETDINFIGYRIKKTDGSHDFSITSPQGQSFFIELKSIYKGKDSVLMYPSQAELAVAVPSKYFLCIIENWGNLNLEDNEVGEKDMDLFKELAFFSNSIGVDLSERINLGSRFFQSDSKFSIEFDENYKIKVKRPAWGNMKFDSFAKEIRRLSQLSSQ